MTALLLRGLRPLVSAPSAAGSVADAELIDVRVDRGRVAALGPTGSVPATGADLLQLDGRWLAPGLWDAHVHLAAAAAAAARVDLSGSASAAEVAARLRAAAAGTDSAPVVGVGFRDGLWAEAPRPELLDAIPAPVVAISADVHTTWSNRAALASIGAPAEHWFAREQLAFDLGTAFSAAPPEVVDRRVAATLHEAAALGVVGLVDFDMDDAGAAWTRRVGTGAAPRIRVRAAVYPQHLDAAIARGQRSGEPIADSELVVGGPYKLFADGSLNTRTAWCDDPYPGTDGDTGIPIHPPGGLAAEVRRGRLAGLTPAVHAIGDAAVAAAIEAIAEGVRSDSEGRGTVGVGSIEHAQLIRLADAARMAELGIEASVQPAHLLDDREVAARHWAGRLDRAYAFRTLLDSGVPLRFGSDAPVAPLNPWLAVSAAVFRAGDGESPWSPAQRLSFAEAVAASSRTRIAVGEPADLVLLDDDPRGLGADALAGVRASATMVAGGWSLPPH